MSAETLRRAAESIRDEDPQCRSIHGCPWHGPVALAVADLLDETALRYCHRFDNAGDCSTLPDGCIVHAPAITVARAYLGESA